MKKPNDLWKNKKWVLAAIAFLLLECYVVLYVLLPSGYAIVDAYRELENRRQKIASVANWKQEIRKMKQSEVRLHEALKDLLLQVPESDRVSILTRFLDQTAEVTDVTINKIRPGAHKIGSQQVNIPVTLTILGDYQNIGEFINKLETAQFVIKVDQTKLYKTSFSTNRVSAELMIDWIVLKGISQKQK